MSLNIHVEAEPRSMHAFADWLRGMSERVDGASRQALQARGQTFGGWESDAGDGFRAVAYRMHSDSDQLQIICKDTARTVEQHANDMAVVREKMTEARDIARKAGLPCTEREIHEPGAAPPYPQALLARGQVSGANEQEELRQAWDAWNAWMDKAKAYARCATLVTEARTIEHDSQNEALGDTEDTASGSGSIITATNFLTGLASGYITRQIGWRTTTAALADNAAEHLTKAQALEHVPGKGQLTVAHMRAAAINHARAARAEYKANTNKIGGWLEKLPRRAQEGITSTIQDLIPRKAQSLVKAPPVVKRLPVIGSALTALAAKNEIDTGKDPGFTVAKHTAGLGAATGTGFLIGGPWGAVAAFVVGTGVTEGIGAAESARYHDPNAETIAPDKDFPR